MPINLTIASNTGYVNESPFVFWQGETAAFNVNYLGVGTLSSPTNTLYRNREDVSGTLLSGSTTVPSGSRTVTTKTATFSIAGDYELYVQVSDGGNTRIDAIRIFVRKLGVY